jgi:hypothetical protein
MNAAEIIHLQEVVKRVPVGDHVIDFAKLARATRPGRRTRRRTRARDGQLGCRTGWHHITAAKAHAVL